MTFSCLNFEQNHIFIITYSFCELLNSKNIAESYITVRSMQLCSATTTNNSKFLANTLYTYNCTPANTHSSSSNSDPFSHPITLILNFFWFTQSRKGHKVLFYKLPLSRENTFQFHRMEKEVGPGNQISQIKSCSSLKIHFLTLKFLPVTTLNHPSTLVVGMLNKTLAVLYDGCPDSEKTRHPTTSHLNFTIFSFPDSSNITDFSYY